MIADAQATTYNLPNLCGLRTYSVTDSSGAALTGNWVTVTGTTTFTITAAPAVDNMYTNPSYSLKLHVVLANYSGVVSAVDIAFTVTVNRYTCTASTVYTASGAMLTSHTYTIGSAAYTFTPPTYTTGSYTCAETVTYSLTKQDGTAAPSCVSMNASTNLVTIYTTDTSFSANILLRVTVTRSQGSS